LSSRSLRATQQAFAGLWGFSWFLMVNKDEFFMVFDGVFDCFSWVNMSFSMVFDGFSWGNIM
jgi:hypothetical protein